MKNKQGVRDPEMHQTRKGNQWYHRCAEAFAHGMKVPVGVVAESGLTHSVQTTSANVHDPPPAAELLHGEETVVYANAGHQGIGERSEMAGKGAELRVAMGPGQCRVLPETPEGRLLNLIETAKAPMRAKGEHPFPVIKQQFSFQKTRLRGIAKNHCKVHVLAALTKLFLPHNRLLRCTPAWEWCFYWAR